MSEKMFKLFQEIGFTIREICELDHAPNHVLKAAVEIRVKMLRREQGRVNYMIGVAKSYACLKSNYVTELQLFAPSNIMFV